MALPTGTRLGPYEILTPIGAGGMGEVYRARDVRLDRDVAVKVLAPQLSANARRRLCLAAFRTRGLPPRGLDHRSDRRQGPGAGPSAPRTVHRPRPRTHTPPKLSRWPSSATSN